MASFRPGIGMMAAETDVPIIPCYLEGTFSAFPSGRRVPRFSKVTVHIGQPREFPDARNRRTGWEHIASILEHDVRTLGGLIAPQTDAGKSKP